MLEDIVWKDETRVKGYFWIAKIYIKDDFLIASRPLTWVGSVIYIKVGF